MNVTTAIGVVAHYNLLERLEPIGPGDLYRARDTHHGRTVIVRLLPAGGDSPGHRTLLAQAEGLLSLSHPNAIALFGAGEHEGRIYLAFEHAAGRSLRMEMAGRPMNARRAVELAIQVADAVAQAHALGYVHSGLSPDAVSVTVRGHAKISAFHLATTCGFEGDGESASLIDYISPEEANGSVQDERSDVYSIGAVLYEMLAARRPLHRGAAAPGTANTTVPKALDDIVLKAVAPNPDRRYQSAAELAAVLRAVVTQLELPEVPGERVVRSRGDGTGRWVVTAGLLVLAAMLVWWFMRR